MNDECLKCPASLACLLGMTKVWKDGDDVEIWVDWDGLPNVEFRRRGLADYVSKAGILVHYKYTPEDVMRCPALRHYAAMEGPMHAGIVNAIHRSSGRRASREGT